MIDPDGSIGEDPFRAYCDMTTEGGGWTLAMTSSDDGQNTWTMNNTAYAYLRSPPLNTNYMTDDTVIGSVDEPNKDFKSLALHTLVFKELLFVHAPSNVTAVYGEVGDYTESFGDFLKDIPYFLYNSNVIPYRYSKTGGTLTKIGKLCDTNLYFNVGDHDGASSNDSTFGPVWNANHSNQGCPFDDPSYASFGPVSSNGSIELSGCGFGLVSGLNTGTPKAAQNYIQMYVR